MTIPESCQISEVTRRKILIRSVAFFGLISIPGFLRRQSSYRELTHAIRDTVTWEEFIAEVLPLAQASVWQGPQTEVEYLHHLARLAVREGWEPKVEAAVRPASHYRQRFLFRRKPFIVCQYEVADGARIEPHDHYGYTAVMKVTRGQARLRTFEFATRDAHSVSPQGVFEVRLTEEKFLRPGDLSVVPMNGPNIHEILEARGDFQFVDLFTFYHSRGYSRRIQIEDFMGRNVSGRTYRARWGQAL